MYLGYKQISLITLVIGVHCFILFGFSFPQKPNQKNVLTPMKIMTISSHVSMNQENETNVVTKKSIVQPLIPKLASSSSHTISKVAALPPQPILPIAQNILQQNKQILETVPASIKNNNQNINQIKEVKEVQQATQMQKIQGIQSTAETNSTNITTTNINHAVSSLNSSISTISQSAKIQGNCPKDIPYPQTAYRLQQEGTVKLKMLVTSEGRGEKVEVVSSSGSHYLDDAAKQAFLRCKFQPAIINGMTQSSWVTKSYTFILTENEE